MKKFLSILLIFCVVFASGTAVYAQPDEKPTVVGQGAILIDASTGQILYEKNSHVQHYPASTTKIMTAILALEQLSLNDKVPIDAETAFTDGSRIYLVEGETVTVKEVMYGLLLESANDSAVALAKKMAGSVDEFAVMMNEKAKELGALDTNFVNPHGLQNAEHLSTAYDLAMIAKYAMKNETFRKYVTTYQYTMDATNKQDTRYFYNTNRLLYDTVHEVTVNGVLRDCKYEGITGIKTGYTPEAGGCLVASAKRGDTELIAVTMASTDMDRFGDAIAMLDYGFANYKTVGTLSAGEPLGEVRVKYGADRNVEVTLSEDAFATLPIEASESVIKAETTLYDSLTAPVKAGQKAGVVKVYEGTKVIAEYDAITLNAVAEGGVLSRIGIPDHIAILLRNVVVGLLSLLFLLLVAYVMVKRHQVKKRRKQRQREREALLRKKEQERARWEEEFFGRRTSM